MVVESLFILWHRFELPHLGEEIEDAASPVRPGPCHSPRPQPGRRLHGRRLLLNKFTRRLTKGRLGRAVGLGVSVGRRHGLEGGDGGRPGSEGLGRRRRQVVQSGLVLGLVLGLARDGGGRSGGGAGSRRELRGAHLANGRLRFGVEEGAGGARSRCFHGRGGGRCFGSQGEGRGRGRFGAAIAPHGGNVPGIRVGGGGGGEGGVRVGGGGACEAGQLWGAEARAIVRGEHQSFEGFEIAQREGGPLSEERTGDEGREEAEAVAEAPGLANAAALRLLPVPAAHREAPREAQRSTAEAEANGGKARAVWRAD
mmetsp:Transcript_9506/g.21592  ORF Transcript_9506/g.21592 Transcript_9506/m.21592 type:complete len:312 (-) Transcript_9506:25-960(-)